MEGFGLTDPVNKEKERLGKAVAELSKYTGLKIGAVVPIELGGELILLDLWLQVY